MKAKRCPKCKGDTSGLAKFARRMEAFEEFAKNCVAAAGNEESDQGHNKEKRQQLCQFLQARKRQDGFMI